MLVLWSVCTAVLLLVTARTAVVSRRPGWRRSRVEAVALRAALPADPELVPAPLLARVGARVARRRLAELAGGLGGAVVALLLLLTGSDAARRGVVVQDGADGAFSVTISSSPLVALLAAATGQVLAVVVVAGREALAPPASPGPRLARSSPPRREDYVPRLETVLVGALVAAPVVVLAAAAAVRLASGRPLVDLGPPAALVAVAALVWAGVEALCRRVLDRPRPAASALELAWDDVLRAQLLRELSQLPLLLASAAGLVVVLQLLAPDGTGPVAWALGLSATVAVLVAALVGVLVSLVTRSPERYVRARLWPLPVDPEGADPALAAPAGLR